MTKSLLYTLVLILFGTVSCTKEDINDPQAPGQNEAEEAIILTAEESERLPLFESDYNRSHEEVLAIANNLMQQIAKEEQQTKAQSPTRVALLTDSIMIAFPETKSAVANMPQDAKIYTVNFGDKSGFTLIAGDKRVRSAVLAYNGSGDFDVDTDNPGAQLAMKLMKDYVATQIGRMEQMRGDSIYNSLQAKYGFGAANKPDQDAIQTKGYDAPYLPMDGMPGGSPDNPYGTRQGSNWQVVSNGLTWYWAPVDRMVDAENLNRQEMMTEVYPMIPAQWSQRWPYNSEVVKIYPGCPAGCVATAMAQIMAYHKKPAGYMWSDYGYNVMANLNWEYNSAFTWEAKSAAVTDNIGKLFLAIGRSVNMDYKPNESGAKPYAIPGGFSSFGYHTSSQLSVDLPQIEYNLTDLKYPVLVGGLNQYGGGHAWVVDGLAQVADYSEQYRDCFYQGEYVGYIKIRTVNYYLNEKYFHCNWGWGSQSDGWYLAGTFNPGSSIYSTNLLMFTGIHY